MYAKHRHGGRVAWITLILLLTSFVHASEALTSARDPTMEFTINQEPGSKFVNTLNLNGTSNIVLQNTTWEITDFSQSPDFDILASGTFLTVVTPISGQQYSWGLDVDVSEMNCTCIIRIHIQAETTVLSKELVVYLGGHGHRPVLLIEEIPESSISSNPGLGFRQNGLLEINVVLPLGNISQAQLIAEVCESPFGVCLGLPSNMSLNFTGADLQLTTDISSDSLGLNDGIWKISLTLIDNYLRKSDPLTFHVQFDEQAPNVEIVSPTFVSEGELFNIYATVDDGYQGASTTTAWTIRSENGTQRAPSMNESVDSTHLQFQFNESGLYEVILYVSDSAGYSSESTVNITVENIQPRSIISVDGLEVINDGEIRVIGSNWTISGEGSFDNEPIEFLWIIDEGRSIRGQSALTFEDLEGTSKQSGGKFTVELIVFDDDGETDSMVIWVDLVTSEGEETASISGAVQLGLILLFIALVLCMYLVIQRSNQTGERLPKWSKSSSTQPHTLDNQPMEESISQQIRKATVEEDEASG